MKAFLCFALFVAAVFAEDKQPEKRAVVGYGGYGYGGVPAYSAAYAGVPALASTYHGGYGGYPYHSGLGYGGYPYGAAALHTPYVPKVAAPLTYPGALGYASALHTPYVQKAVAPYSAYGYSSPYVNGYHW